MTRSKEVNKNSKLYMRICILIVLIAVFSAGVSVIATISRIKNKAKQTCHETACIHAAQEILETLDTTVDPCEDFYSFTCGSWKEVGKHKEISAVEHFYSKILKKIRHLLEGKGSHDERNIYSIPKNFFKICMDEELTEKNDIVEVKKLLELSANGWPVLKGNGWPSWNFVWSQTVQKLFRFGFEMSAPFGVDVDVNLSNSTFRSIQLVEPTFTVLKELLRNDLQNEYLQIYLNFMIDVAELFGADRKNAKVDMLEVLKLESKIAGITVQYSNKVDNLSETFNFLTIDELQRKYSYVNWLEFLGGFFEKIHLEGNDLVQVESPVFFSHLGNILKTTPKRVLANYIIWNAIYEVIPYLPKRFNKLKKVFKEKLLEPEESKPRWKICVEETVEVLPNLVTALYVKKYFHKDTKIKASKIVKDLKLELMDKLLSVDWLSDEDRKVAFRKAAHLTESVGFHDELLNDDILEKEYKMIKILPKSYLATVLSINSALRSKNFNDLRQKSRRVYWKHDVDFAIHCLYYNSKVNKVDITLPCLEGAFFDRKKPFYMNYGSLGWAIGHEITYGFDQTGSQLDEGGTISFGWENKSSNSFVAVEHCLLERFSDIYKRYLNESDNDVKMADSHFADVSGISLAYSSYKTQLNLKDKEIILPGLDFDQNQLFWISAAKIFCERSDHIIGRERVLTAFSNMEEFSADFQCKKGSGMNPEKKCKIW